MKVFLVDLRNKMVFVFSWLVFIWLIFYSSQGMKEISLSVLWQLFVLSLSGSALFNLFFSGVLFKKLSFAWRLTCFIVSCAIVEGVLIYNFQLFGITKLVEWGLFLLIVLVLYFVSLGIFQIYKTKSGKHYTDLLKEYQERKFG
jgi:hypothetical protein